jgi:hypothetical protein
MMVRNAVKINVPNNRDTGGISPYFKHGFLYSYCSHLEHRASVKRFVSLQFLNLRHSVGLLGRVISPSQGRYLTQTQNEDRQTSMPRVGFEPTIPVFVRAKTVHALDRAATVIGYFKHTHIEWDKPVASVLLYRTLEGFSSQPEVLVCRQKP